jgi:uncharacterized protein
VSSTGTDPTSTVRVLTERECWDRLKQHDFGRVAVGAHDDLAIYPVNYLVAGGGIRIRTSPGSKLISMLLDPYVAFEIDAQEGDTAWSVLVKGTAEEMVLPKNPRVAPDLPTTFVDTPKYAAVAITPTSITGRVFTR